MPYENQLSAGDRELERQLKRLEPAGHGIDRDTLMFRAGRTSARRGLRVWKAGSGALLLLIGGLAFWNSRPAGPIHVSETADGGDARSTLSAEVATDASMPARGPCWTVLSGDYLRVRELVTVHGVEALPSTPYESASSDPTDSIAAWLKRSRVLNPSHVPAAFPSETDNGGRS